MRRMLKTSWLAMALAATSLAGDTGKRADAWRAPANRVRLMIDWAAPAAVAGKVPPAWPFLLYVRGVPTKKSEKIENEVLANTAVILAARLCRLVQITPDDAASLPYLKRLPQILDPMLVAVAPDYTVQGVVSDERKLTAASCLGLMTKIVDDAYETPLRKYLSSYGDILERSEALWRDEQKLAADAKRAVAPEEKAELERRREEVLATERALASREAAFLQEMRLKESSDAGAGDGGLTADEKEALRAYREHAEVASPVEAAYALAALRGRDSGAMAAAVFKEAARGPWSAWKAGELLAGMRSLEALQAIRDALSQRGLARTAALAATARKLLPGCQDALVALAGDRDASVREAAVGALGVQRG
ncbi:MAG: hypothetical protein ACHQ1G_12700, partial [Planctomycetota bacterium]